MKESYVEDLYARVCVRTSLTQETVDSVHPGENTQCVVLLWAQVDDVGSTVSGLERTDMSWRNQ